MGYERDGFFKKNMIVVWNSTPENNKYREAPAKHAFGRVIEVRARGSDADLVTVEWNKEIPDTRCLTGKYNAYRLLPASYAGF